MTTSNVTLFKYTFLVYIYTMKPDSEKYLSTGPIQFVVLTTLSLKLQLFYDKIENLYNTNVKDINFLFFGKFISAFD